MANTLPQEIRPWLELDPSEAPEPGIWDGDVATPIKNDSEARKFFDWIGVTLLEAAHDPANYVPRLRAQREVA